MLFLSRSDRFLQLLCNKKAASVKVNKKEIARLLSEGKEDKGVYAI
jgi:hydroxyethylthiazole kinase-like sugar kinase family protein